MCLKQHDDTHHLPELHWHLSLLSLALHLHGAAVQEGLGRTVGQTRQHTTDQTTYLPVLRRSLPEQPCILGSEGLNL